MQAVQYVYDPRRADYGGTLDRLLLVDSANLHDSMTYNDIVLLDDTGTGLLTDA